MAVPIRIKTPPEQRRFRRQGAQGVCPIWSGLYFDGELINEREEET
jgi:hypothetical protein